MISSHRDPSIPSSIRIGTPIGMTIVPFCYTESMLTKTDLKQIEGVVGKVVKKVVKKELGKGLAPIKKDITKIRSDMAIMSSFFDNEYLGLRSRVERIEHHIGFATA